MLKPYPLILTEDEQAKLVKLIENIRSHKVNGCDNEVFTVLAPAMEVMGLEMWQWRKFLLRRDEESPEGLEYTLFYITDEKPHVQPKGLNILLSERRQDKLTRRSQRRATEITKEATVTYTNGRKPNGHHT